MSEEDLLRGLEGLVPAGLGWLQVRLLTDLIVCHGN